MGTAIKQATAQANKAIATISSVDKALQIATAAAILGASIASMNPSAVGTGLDGLVKAIAGSTTPSGGTTATGTASPGIPTAGAS
jgi:ribosomal protein S5